MNCFNMVLNVHATLFVANIRQPNTSPFNMVLHLHPAYCFLVAHIAIQNGQTHMKTPDMVIHSDHAHSFLVAHIARMLFIMILIKFSWCNLFNLFI